jgi:hypothetical protein
LICHRLVSPAVCLAQAGHREGGDAVLVDITANEIRIQDADDCSRLSVTTVLAGDDLDAALHSAHLGTRDEASEANTVLLDVAELHARARAAASAADWQSRWSAMLGYAASKGWLTPDGAAVRAHLA